MAWTINNGKLYFNSVLYTGNGGTNNVTGVGFNSDFTWIKNRATTGNPALFDKINGVTKYLNSNNQNGLATSAPTLTAWSSDGFTIGSSTDLNGNGNGIASWNWLAAGATPSNTYVVKVVSDGGNKYRFDDFGTSAVTLEISEGGTFTFDQSDSSNNGHPLRFSTTSDGTHGGGSEYTTGITVSGTPGQAGAKTVIVVAASAPTLYYYCTVHSGMGGQANTPITNSFSNFAGSIQSNISPNTTSGFSIVKYTGTGSNATIGHGLGAAPSMIIVKDLSEDNYDWMVYHQSLGATKYIRLNLTSAVSTSTTWQDTAPTNQVFSVVSNSSDVNKSGNNFLAYCFAEKQGYSKFGSYVGNGSTNGTFVYTGFRPAFAMFKDTTSARDWTMLDNKRNTFNVMDKRLFPNNSDVENDTDILDFTSQGIKIRSTNTSVNVSGNTYIFMAFAENPITSSTGVPSTAR